MTLPLLAALALLAAPSVRAAEPALLNDVKVESRRVVLRLSRPVAFRAKAEADPPKLLITFSDADIKGEERDIATTKGVPRWVSTARASEGGLPAVRVTIHLDSPRDYDPAWAGSDLTLTFKGPPPQATAPAEAPKAAPRAKASAAEPEPASADAPPPPPAKRRRAFRVQLGSFPEEKSALKLKAEFEHLLDPLEVLTAQVAGKTVHRVAMGPFPDRAAAQAALEKAAAQGQKGIITRD